LDLTGALVEMAVYYVTVIYPSLTLRGMTKTGFPLSRE